MIGNLVANSVAYGDQRYPITITTEFSSSFAEIAVHNHGHVIPRLLIPQLFEPMTRARDREDAVSSVGLGSFIVREIVKAHSGTIAVSSTPWLGTTFLVRLPSLPTSDYPEQ